MKEYTLGFLFSPEKDKVVLVLKNRPLFQIGKFNGIGGMIEENEIPIDGMIREFHEETGVRINDWTYFITMKNKDWLVYCYTAISPNYISVKTKTDEEVHIINLIDMPNINIMSNLTWLIPMALNTDRIDYDIANFI